MISIIDTHAHVDLSVFDGDRESVLDEARRTGVHAIVLIGYDPDRWRTTSTLCDARSDLVRSVGVHPNSADLWTDAVLAQLHQEATENKVVAIGEIGLDFYRDHANPDRQREAFRAQLQLAQTLNLPVIIHQRSAQDEMLGFLRDASPLTGVMHCFDGDLEFARSCLDLGMYLGIGGSVTYPRSDGLREALKAVNLDRLVVETDSPFLAPQSRRGKRNEPALVRQVVDALAALYGLSSDEISDITSRNATALFGPQLAVAQQAGKVLATCA